MRYVGFDDILGYIAEHPRSDIDSITTALYPQCDAADFRLAKAHTKRYLASLHQKKLIRPDGCVGRAYLWAIA